MLTVKALKGGSALRTPEFKAYSHDTFVVGQGAIFYADPIEPAASFRMVYTSDVLKIEHKAPNVVLLHTTSGSIYEVTAD